MSREGALWIGGVRFKFFIVATLRSALNFKKTVEVIAECFWFDYFSVGASHGRSIFDERIASIRRRERTRVNQGIVVSKAIFTAQVVIIV